MLGASFVREGGALKIAKIYRGDQADNQPSPLLEPGVGVAEGEYLLAVNNRPIQADLPLEALMQGLAGKRVVLTVSAKPTLEGSRQVVVTPLAEESGLRHADWVRKNREYVYEKSNGKLGYIHIPDMGGAGLVAFETWFYPQADRDGLVIDVRWNRGGFVSQLILEKLRRPIDGWVVPRHGVPSPYPYARRSGPLVVITNEFAGSDGDIFPKAMQIEGLAPVIGKRSWGGVIGIRADKPAVDSGFLSQPEYAFFFRNGGWQVENQGVIPDIEVPWLPQEVASGVDPQLDRAIAEALRRIGEAPPRPPLDPRPEKTREEYQRKEP
jgi:tricorn protease